MGIVTGIVASAVVGGGISMMAADAQAEGTAAASSTQAAATVEATQIQSDASKYSIDQQREMYEQGRSDQEPWRLAGSRALEAIQNTPDFEFTAENFMQMKDPSYEWRVDQGVKAMDNSAASRGNMFSGAAAKALTEYGQNMGSQEYQNAYNRAADTYDRNLNTQKSLAGVGQSATNATNQMGMSTAGNIGRTSMSGANAMSNIAMTGGANQANLAMQGGANQAALYGNLAQSVNSGMSNYLMYSMNQ